MIGRAFVDTNVLVYCYDTADPGKQQRALEIVGESDGFSQLVLSTQVLQEFYVTVVRKLKQPLSEEDAEKAVLTLSALPVVQIDTAMVLASIATSQRFQFSLRDALIIEAARGSACEVVLTEDLQHEMDVDGVRVHNPFA